MAKLKDMTPVRKYREAPLSRLTIIQQTHDVVPEILWLTRYTRVSATEVAFVFQDPLLWMTGKPSREVKMLGEINDEWSLNYVLLSLGVPEGEVGQRVCTSQYFMRLAPVFLALDTSKRRVNKLRTLNEDEVARVLDHDVVVMGTSPLAVV